MFPFKLTEENLLLHKACEGGIDFARRNDMFGRTLKEISGEYGAYAWWFENRITIELDEKGNKIRETDASGISTTFTYDEKGNMLSMTDTHGNTWKFTHDARGNILSTTDSLGQISYQEFDDNNNLVRKLCADGRYTIWEYDDNGNILHKQNSYGIVWNFTYDEKGNILTESLNDRRNIIIHTYNDNGNKIRTTNSAGQTWLWTYDKAGNMLSIAKPQKYAYSENGNKGEDLTTWVYKWLSNNKFQVKENKKVVLTAVFSEEAIKAE